MADMSHAAQECIDDYFKREAGGTGLLASTQQSSSSLASAQPSGGEIPHLPSHHRCRWRQPSRRVQESPTSVSLKVVGRDRWRLPSRRCRCWPLPSRHRWRQPSRRVEESPTSVSLKVVGRDRWRQPSRRVQESPTSVSLKVVGRDRWRLPSRRCRCWRLPSRRRRRWRQPSRREGIPHHHQSQGGGEGPLASGQSREVEVPIEQRAIDLAEVSTVK